MNLILDTSFLHHLLVYIAPTQNRNIIQCISSTIPVMTIPPPFQAILLHLAIPLQSPLCNEDNECDTLALTNTFTVLSTGDHSTFMVKSFFSLARVNVMPLWLLLSPVPLSARGVWISATPTPLGSPVSSERTLNWGAGKRRGDERAAGHSPWPSCLWSRGAGDEHYPTPLG